MPFSFPFFRFPHHYYMHPPKVNAEIEKNRIADISHNTISRQEEPFFNILGFHLFLDDIIIICLLLFLYQEQVTDQILYIILLLLLFS